MTPTDDILAVKRRHARDLLGRTGVCGLDVDTGEDGRPVITIHLDTDDPAVRKQLPKQLDGYPVRVVKTGPYRKY